MSDDKKSILMCWFDDKGELQFKTENMTIYTAIGVLHAAQKMFDSKITFTPIAPAIQKEKVETT